MDTLRKQLPKVAIVVSAIFLLIGNALADNNQDKTAKGMKLSPPPGPFFNGDPLIASKKNALVAPIEPAMPVSNSHSPEGKANSLEFKMLLPELKKVEFKEPKQRSIPTKKLIAPVMQQSAPKLSREIGKSPERHQMPFNNTKEETLISSKNTPIWMHRGSLVNPKAKIVKNSKNQNNKTNMQDQINNRMPIIGWNYPVQQYMYIPVAMMIPSTMPQMPLAPSFNYGAPMPLYNNVPLGNNGNRTIGEIVIPAKKENK